MSGPGISWGGGANAWICVRIQNSNAAMGVGESPSMLLSFGCHGPEGRVPVLHNGSMEIGAPPSLSCAFGKVESFMHEAVYKHRFFACRTVTVTPPSEAGPFDSLARNDPSVLVNSSCSRNLLGTTLCTPSGIQVGAEILVAGQLHVLVYEPDAYRVPLGVSSEHRFPYYQPLTFPSHACAICTVQGRAVAECCNAVSAWSRFASPSHVC